MWVYRLLFVILFCLLFFVCTVTDFSGADKASGVKFCTVVHRRPGQEISHLGGTFLQQKPKIGRIGHPPGSKVEGGNCFRNRVPINIARRVDVGLAYVDIRPSPKTDVLVINKLTLKSGSDSN